MPEIRRSNRPPARPMVAPMYANEPPEPEIATPEPVAEPCGACQLLTLVRRGDTIHCENPDCPTFGVS